MKKKKSLMIIIIIIVILIGIFILFQNQSNKKDYFVIGDYGTFKYEKGKWSTFDRESNNIFDNKFNVYIDNQEKGKYEIRYFNDKWYYFDNEMDSQNFTGNLFAYYSDKNMSVANVEKETLTESDMVYLNKVLKKEKITMQADDYYRINEKISFDIDGDDIEENIYAVSNADIMENNGKTFSCLYYVKNDKPITLVLETYDNNEDEYLLYSVNTLFKMENNGKYYLSIDQFSDMSNENNGVLLYGLNSLNKYKLLVSSDDKTEDKSKKNNGIFYIIIPVVILVLGVYIFYRKVSAEEID